MLDKKGLQILDALRQNSRKTVKEIAKETGVPRTTVFERIRRMEQTGLIKAYSLVPDYAQLELGTLAYVLISYDKSAHLSQKEVAQAIARLPGVSEVHIMSGEWDLLAKVRGKSMQAIGDLVVGKIRGLAGVEKTHTMPVFYPIKEEF